MCPLGGEIAHYLWATFHLHSWLLWEPLWLWWKSHKPLLGDSTGLTADTLMDSFVIGREGNDSVWASSGFVWWSMEKRILDLTNETGVWLSAWTRPLRFLEHDAGRHAHTRLASSSDFYSLESSHLLFWWERWALGRGDPSVGPRGLVERVISSEVVNIDWSGFVWRMCRSPKSWD